MFRPAPTRLAAFALIAASLACAGCPMCHNTAKCPRLDIGYGVAGADDGNVHVVGYGVDETFQWGDDNEKDDVVCNAMLETHAAGMTGGIAVEPPKGAPQLASVVRIGCYRRSEELGAMALFGVALCLGDVSEWTSPRTFEVVGGFDPIKQCGGATPSAGTSFQSATGAGCWGDASVRVVVERATGTRMDFPKVVSDDFVRVMRIELTMPAPMTGTVGGKPNGAACTGPKVTGSARLVLQRSGFDYQPDAICPCLG